MKDCSPSVSFLISSSVRILSYLNPATVVLNESVAYDGVVMVVARCVGGGDEGYSQSLVCSVILDCPVVSGVVEG